MAGRLLLILVLATAAAAAEDGEPRIVDPDPDPEKTAMRERLAALEAENAALRQRAAKLRTITQVARNVAFELNIQLAEAEDRIAELEGVVPGPPPAADEAGDEGEDPNAAASYRGVVTAVRESPDRDRGLMILFVADREHVFPGPVALRDEEGHLLRCRLVKVLEDMVVLRLEDGGIDDRIRERLAEGRTLTVVPAGSREPEE